MSVRDYFSPSNLLNQAKRSYPGAYTVASDIASARVDLSVSSDKFGTALRLGTQIAEGGYSPNPKISVSSSNVSTKVAGQPNALVNDWRVTLGFPSSSTLTKYYSSPLLYPLYKTGGVVFPYTPQITINYAADWQGAKLTHSNYTPLFYHASEIQNMQVQGVFTAVNAEEAQYLLAVLTFGRLVTKMFFGEGEFVGNPPPILHLNGYGEYNFNKTPVVLQQFTYTFPSDVDYISIYNPTADVNDASYSKQQNSNTSTRVPTEMNLMFTVTPIYSRSQVSQFSYQDFANGTLIQKGFV